MKIWGIADTHLAENRVNTMACYGSVWEKHREKIIENWHSTVSNQDTVLIGGDTTWATDLSRAMIDINLLNDLPGKQKFIVKGNHDVWWKTLNDVNKAMPQSMIPLSGNAIETDGHVICGTMGWLAPNDPSFDSLDMNFFRKELALLDEALQAAEQLDPKNGLHLLLHFPPFTTTGLETPFFELITRYPVSTCTFGHFHLAHEWECVPQGKIDGIDFRLIATDFLQHKPYLVWGD